MKKAFALSLLVLFSCWGISQELTATEIIQKADDKIQGEKTSISEMTMKVVRPTWDRTISFKTWSKGRDYSITYIKEPAKEKGQTFLKREVELWNWNPRISRMIKLPPSMMSQGWMGSDYSNDDILKESSIVIDYDHQLAGKDMIEGTECYRIEMLPGEDAAVVWGKVIKWISADEFLQMKSEYYDEDGYLVRSDYAYDLKVMDNRLIPTRIEIVPAEEEGKKTILFINQITFNEPIPDAYFSQQNMKKIK